MFHGARHAFGAPSQHSFWFSPILKSRTKNHTVSQTQVAAAAGCIDVVLLQTRMVMRPPGTIPTPELSQSSLADTLFILEAGLQSKRKCSFHVQLLPLIYTGAELR